LLLAFLLLPGCGSCRQQEPDKTAKPAPPKPDYEFVRLMTKPNDLVRVQTAVKPGHWNSANLEVVANRDDFRGQVTTDPFPLPMSSFELGSDRSLFLTKSQKKLIDLAWFLPSELPQNTLALNLISAASGRRVLPGSFPLQIMPAHQFHFVILANEPDRYGYVPGLSAVNPSLDQGIDTLRGAHYRVEAPKVDRLVPLPNGALYWTGIAYLLWDDFDPQKLSPPQQQALVDWLHWGGQLIVSGPQSLDMLRGSFLEPWLPARSAGACELTAESFAELNRLWTPSGRSLEPVKPWAGVILAPRDQATTLVSSGDQPLVVEQRIGRGRVVVSAFSLAQRELIAWPGFDSFFNGCLMRRLPRTFATGIDGLVYARWYDKADSDSPEMPLRHTQFRIFARDAHLPETEAETKQRDSASSNAGIEQDDSDLNPVFGPSVSEWDDTGELANQVRESLREAAGIEIPDRAFVLKMLGFYLAVLVPLNWIVFRLAGRLEWAWVAAPLVALAFAVIVTRMARLDLGFVRAQNELGIVELQPGYPRAHVTRYTSLYTSLTTSYEVTSEDPGAVALPFSATGRGLLTGQEAQVAVYKSTDSMSLTGMTVSSNSLGMVHSEQLVEVDGSIELAPGGLEVTNRSRLDLEGAILSGPLGIAWIGKLRAGRSVPVKYLPRTEEDSMHELRRQAADASGTDIAATIFPLVRWAEQTSLGDDIRLVGWTTTELPGLTIEPRASQGRQMHVVVAHLKFGAGPAPRPDINSRAQPLPPPPDPNALPAEATP
jgi:hypothetical protein